MVNLAKGMWVTCVKSIGNAQVGHYYQIDKSVFGLTIKVGKIDYNLSHRNIDLYFDLENPMIGDPQIVDGLRPVKTLSYAPEPSKHSVLQQAEELINGDRAKDYGDVRVNFKRIADGWTVILGKEITPRQVGLCMAWLKIAREVHKPKADNIVDACGYLGLLEKLD